MGQMMFPKYLVVVDDNVDVHNTREVLFRLCANTEPQRACRAEAGRTPMNTNPTAAEGEGTWPGKETVL